MCRFSSSSGAVCEMAVEIPQLQHVEAWMLGGALCTGTGPGFDPRHQGGEGVAGSPGACSQVFCHPIRCKRIGV